MAFARPRGVHKTPEDVSTCNKGFPSYLGNKSSEGSAYRALTWRLVWLLAVDGSSLTL